jgi:hypothetical protein
LTFWYNGKLNNYSALRIYAAAVSVEEDRRQKSLGEYPAPELRRAADVQKELKSNQKQAWARHVVEGQLGKHLTMEHLPEHYQSKRAKEYTLASVSMDNFRVVGLLLENTFLSYNIELLEASDFAQHPTRPIRMTDAVHLRLLPFLRTWRAGTSKLPKVQGVWLSHPSDESVEKWQHRLEAVQRQVQHAMDASWHMDLITLRPAQPAIAPVDRFMDEQHPLDLRQRRADFTYGFDKTAAPDSATVTGTPHAVHVFTYSFQMDPETQQPVPDLLHPPLHFEVWIGSKRTVSDLYDLLATKVPYLPGIDPAPVTAQIRCTFRVLRLEAPLPDSISVTHPVRVGQLLSEPGHTFEQLGIGQCALMIQHPGY